MAYIAPSKGAVSGLAGQLKRIKQAKLFAMNNPQCALILATMAIVVVLTACTTSSSEALLLPTALRCADCPTVAVTGTVDGDTLDTTQGRLRLFGVDTPERRERCFTEATDRLSGLAGELIRVESGPRATDPFGRSLYYVFTMAGHSVEAILIREGLGTAWTRDGQHHDYLMALEESAREQKVGCLWGR